MWIKKGRLFIWRMEIYGKEILEGNPGHQFYIIISNRLLIHFKSIPSNLLIMINQKY